MPIPTRNPFITCRLAPSIEICATPVYMTIVCTGVLGACLCAKPGPLAASRAEPLTARLRLAWHAVHRVTKISST